MSRTHAPGESPHIEEVKEQRVSGILVSIMVGLSVLMAKVLRLIPLSVLFGVFLYMGIASMSGVQFFERIRLFLMPVKHHPMTNYARRVPTWKMHVFTLLQMISLVVLWVVKSSRFSLAFPFLLLMMVPLRQKLDSFYTPQEMRAVSLFFPLINLFYIFNRIFHLTFSLTELNLKEMTKKNQTFMNKHLFQLKLFYFSLYCIFYINLKDK